MGKTVYVVSEMNADTCVGDEISGIFYSIESAKNRVAELIADICETIMEEGGDELDPNEFKLDENLAVNVGDNSITITEYVVE